MGVIEARLTDPSQRRLAVTVALLAVGAAVLVTGTSSASDEPSLAPVPQARCGPGSLPETDIQGRVPKRDYDSGRARKGYRCNTRLVSHFGHSGGFKTLRYRDARGHVCAFYDSTLMFPTDVPFNVGSEGVGVVVLAMDDPAHPRRTATLSTPAMDSPHESLLLNKKRGLLAAESGNLATAPGQVDVYSVRRNCRQPQLLSTTPVGGLGHESGWAPDGRTFYVSSTGGQTLTALDMSDPRLPVPVFTQVGVNYHGIRVSNDGDRLYVADLGTVDEGVVQDSGLRIVDVSEIQDRRPAPQVHVLADYTWRSVSIPQAASPVVINGTRYLVEMDEFADFSSQRSISTNDPDAEVGAARIINIEHERRPFVVSNVRLRVNNQKARHGPQQRDPGNQLPVQGYAGHYCSVPRRVDPRLMACSFIASGLRVFDITHPYRPREVAYFNKPLMPGVEPGREGAWAMSTPAWDLRHHQVWYTDGNTGFYAVKITNGMWPEGL